jgi:uncharacterized protein YqgC (DUF456 family)
MPPILLKIIFIVLMLPGVFMVFIPMIPGIPYMFAVAALFGFIDGFQNLTPLNLGILGGILIASIFIDYFAGILGAKYGGASKKGIFCGFLGLIIGLILFPPFGGFLGLFAGVLAAEFIAYKDKKRALKAATGSFLGSVSGVFINTCLAVVFFILFIIFTIF